MAVRRIAGSWWYLWDKREQITVLGPVGYYGFTTSEEMKKSLHNYRQHSRAARIGITFTIDIVFLG